MAYDEVGRKRSKILSAPKQQPTFHPEKAARLVGETVADDRDGLVKW